MLHLTNGDVALAHLRDAGIFGDILAWRDVLHEGPVPAGLDEAALAAVRARFIAACGWGEEGAVRADLAARDAALEAAVGREDELVLWFEPDLYDQLQLIQVLARLAGRDPGRTRLALVQTDRPIPHLPRTALPELLDARQPLGREALAAGEAAFAALRSPDPRDLAALARHEVPLLPHLAPALGRHLEQFPGARDGLARSERQILRVLAGGPRTASQAFRDERALEEHVFLADSVFRLYLERLMAGSAPLLAFADASPAEFWQRPLALTAAGREVLEGRRDRLALQPVERWLGGVHLRPGALWRHDAGTGRVQGAA